MTNAGTTSARIERLARAMGASVEEVRDRISAVVARSGPLSVSQAATVRSALGEIPQGRAQRSRTSGGRAAA